MKLTEEQLDWLIDQLADTIADRREQDPLANYAGRLYVCRRCGTVDAACAPAVDLVDDYPCPSCGRPQKALTDVGIPVEHA